MINPSPFRTRFVHLTLEAWGINAQHANAKSLILGNLLLDSIGRDMGRPPMEELAVIIGEEWINKSNLANLHAVRGGPLASHRIHDR